MSEKFSIRLLGPAKVTGQRRQAGDVVEVDRNEFDHLVAAGVVEDRPTDEVAEQVAKEDLTVSLEALEVERNAAIARAVEAESQRDMLQGRLLELQAQIDAAPRGGEDNTPISQESDATKSTAQKTARGGSKKG